MRPIFLTLAVLFAWSVSVAIYAQNINVLSDEEKNAGFVLLFDGKSLEGWEGDPNIWSVADGVIVGQTEAEGPKKLAYNTFLTYKKKEFGNFVLRFDIKISESGNSGMQYRSWMMPGDQPYRVAGYQADFDGKHTYSGILYGEGFGGFICKRGEETFLDDSRKPQTVRRFAEDAALKKELKVEDWNTYEVTAEGFTFTNKINGHVTNITTDRDEAKRKATGLLALQAHVGPPMKVEVRNVRIKEVK